MSERKYWCWFGKHDVVVSGFSGAYTHPKYDKSGRICIECAKKKYQARKKKLLEDAIFFKVIG